MAVVLRAVAAQERRTAGFIEDVLPIGVVGVLAEARCNLVAQGRRGELLFRHPLAGADGVIALNKLVNISRCGKRAGDVLRRDLIFLLSTVYCLLFTVYCLLYTRIDTV